MITFVIGGCKSGKSAYALELAEAYQHADKIFFATGIAFDDEMKNRIERHQKDRGSDWKTIEAPLKLAEAIRENNREKNVILVDCLTIWINNLLMENVSSDKIIQYANNLMQELKKCICPVILVSNEVGAGIVPENKLARQFRDLAGVINRKTAQYAHRVFWMVAGIPVNIK